MSAYSDRRWDGLVPPRKHHQTPRSGVAGHQKSTGGQQLEKCDKEKLGVMRKSTDIHPRHNLGDGVYPGGKVVAPGKPLYRPRI